MLVYKFGYKTLKFSLNISNRIKTTIDLKTL